MTLVPLVVGICLSVQDPEYKQACEAALVQGASQSGVAARFEHHSRKVERWGKQQVKVVVSDEATAAVVFSVIGFSYQFSQNQESSLSIKIAPRTTGQFKFKQDAVGIGIRYDF